MVRTDHREIIQTRVRVSLICRNIDINVFFLFQKLVKYTKGVTSDMNEFIGTRCNSQNLALYIHLALWHLRRCFSK